MTRYYYYYYYLLCVALARWYSALRIHENRLQLLKIACDVCVCLRPCLSSGLGEIWLKLSGVRCVRLGNSSRRRNTQALNSEKRSIYSTQQQLKSILKVNKYELV
jgi:hypothetical protein